VWLRLATIIRFQGGAALAERFVTPVFDASLPLSSWEGLQLSMGDVACPGGQGLWDGR
jgi:hypothetical protein